MYKTKNVPNYRVFEYNVIELKSENKSGIKMQIDFHYGTVYVLSRMAGFNPEEAYIIAYSSQYVDDAELYCALGQPWKNNTREVICFSDGTRYEPVCSSMNRLDIYNDLIKPIEYKVWVAFHFMPAGVGKTLGQKLVCKKACNERYYLNRLAHQMVNNFFRNCMNKPEALYILGIMMHVFADTFAHHGFSGIFDKRNRANNTVVLSPQGYDLDSYAPAIPPLGHANLIHLPDYPFIIFRYTDMNNTSHYRENIKEYTLAADWIFRILRGCREIKYGDNGPDKSHVKHDRELIIKMFREVIDADGNKRNEVWKNQIINGSFKCCNANGKEKAEYYSEGDSKSWLGEVMKICPVIKSDKKDHVNYRLAVTDFLNSNYKQFHDALKYHQNYVLNTLLPDNGIVMTE